MSKIISFYNNKGGVGKTTTTLMFAQIKAKEGKKVLCIDLDSQCNLTSQLGKINSELSIYDLFTDNAEVKEIIRTYDDNNLKIDFIDGSIKLQLLNQQLPSKAMLININEILKNKLKTIKEEYDYILIDCPPTMDVMVSNALVTSTEVIIPLKADRYSVDGIKMLLEHINMIKNNFNNELKIASMFLNYYKRSNINDNFYKELTENLDFMSNVKVHDYVAVAENTVESELLISSKNKNHKVVAQFEELFKEMDL